MRQRELQHVLDEQLRLRRWPTRRAMRLAVLAYLATKFRPEDYTEGAVNALLRHWHVFDDPALLRRELYDRGFLGRTRDGRRYWVIARGTEGLAVEGRG